MQQNQQGAGRSGNETGLVLHATTVALQGQAVLIQGASGRGKSSLALQLMSMGAGLVADDRTWIWREVRGADGDAIIADAPDALVGRIEARGIGILAAKAVGPCRIGLVVDLDQPEEMRLPPYRTIDLLGLCLPLVHRVDSPAFPAAILQYLTVGRVA
ncbi:MAG: serine kinase [Rhodobacterales bacterium]|nr:serine kinase [Rhodobacterales bacterium]MDX5389834.1 serine kinase [Rhodobacterales bacterium]MDX5489531.1 serine kinase [Rhodobacterales bacterium]